MQEPVSNAALEHLFSADEGLPCSEGTELLRAFAGHRPADFAFLQRNDLVDLRNSAFDGIPEWDAFSQHYGTCERCNA
jgi:hypothetical protein